jgi:hypothetical protein
LIQRLNEASIATMTMPADQARLKEIGADVVAPERRSPDFLECRTSSSVRRQRDREMGAMRAAGVAGE